MKYPHAKFKKLLVLSILAVCLILTFFPQNTYAKDYYFPKVRVNIYINKDGSFDITEERTFRFSGEFHWATYTIEKVGFKEITNFSIADESGPYTFIQAETETPGTFTFEDRGSQYYSKFFYNVADTEKTFTISYTVLGGIPTYIDTSDFYWKLVGNGWDKKTELMEGFIYLPEKVLEDSIKVFGHGPLNGTVSRIDGQGAYYRIENLEPNTFVEARILFPSEILDVVPLPEKKLDEIMNEELHLAEEADNVRQRARINLFILILIPILLFAFWLYIFTKYGREYKPTRDIIYTRDIPEDLSPAIVGYLLRFKKITPNDFTATMMDLIRKGCVAIETRKEEKGLVFKREVPVTYLTKLDKDPQTLLPQETIVYDFLFTSLTYESLSGLFRVPKKRESFMKPLSEKDGVLPGIAGKEEITVSTDDISTFIKKNPKEFRAIYEAFTEAAKEEAEKKNYFEKSGQGLKILFTIITFALPFIGFFLGAATNLFFIIPVYFILPFLFFILLIPLGRRSKEGAEAYALWNGLKRFLLHFSNFKSAIPTSIAIWEQYLVYAVTFGISEQVIKEMQIILPAIPEEELKSSHFFAYTALSSSLPNINAAVAFGNIVNTMVSSFNAISSAASSSGGGGGFSGGGGGGGGGGGSGGGAG